MRGTLTMIICCICILAAWPVQASECGFMDGGYCVDQILEETQQILQQSSKNAPSIQTVAAGMPKDGTYTYTNYESLWDWLISSELAQEQDKKIAFEEAAQAGGTKIGGVNLVVLAARTLQKLVDLKIIPLTDAQQILNGARK